MTGASWTVELSSAAARSIALELGRAGSLLETGGILLGHDDAPRRATTVTVAGEPGPAAIREPRFFLRDLPHASALATRSWSDDGSVWVGEWHTHTSGPPVPSKVDVTSYLRHLGDPELAFERFVSVIVSVSPGTPQLAAWMVTPDR